MVTHLTVPLSVLNGMLIAKIDHTLIAVSAQTRRIMVEPSLGIEPSLQFFWREYASG